MGFTENLTINGTKNLLTELVAAGYQGPAILDRDGSFLQNMDAAVVAYFHRTASSANAPGERQVERINPTGTITAAGNAVATVTASGLTGSPVAVNFPVTVGMADKDKAASLVKALTDNVPINTFAEPLIDYGAGLVYLKKRATAANDATFNIAITDPNVTGITPDAASDNDTAGALHTTNGMPFDNAGTGPSPVMTLAQGTDLSTIWIHTPSSITINASIA